MSDVGTDRIELVRRVVELTRAIGTHPATRVPGASPPSLHIGRLLFRNRPAIEEVRHHLAGDSRVNRAGLLAVFETELVILVVLRLELLSRCGKFGHPRGALAFRQR